MTKILKPIRANAGIEAAYRKALTTGLAQLVASTQHWVTAAYRKDAPLLAQDAMLENVTGAFAALRTRWLDRWEIWAPKVAEKYVTQQFKATDSAFRSALKDAGVAVDFKMTPAMTQALEASIAENVALIKSIPQQYLNQVEGVVMRGYTAGRDLATITRELKALSPKTGKRCALIARDQCNKANAVTNRARQLELGITQAKWMHSSAGKEPRQAHVAANGKVFDVAEGCLIDGEHIQPGQLINCRCTSRAILPVSLTGR